MTAIEHAPTSLEKLRIANPCPARWEVMEGDDRVRFCQSCKKNVYNLSALQRSEAEALVARHSLFGGHFFTARPKPSNLAVEVKHEPRPEPRL